MSIRDGFRRRIVARTDARPQRAGAPRVEDPRAGSVIKPDARGIEMPRLPAWRCRNRQDPHGVGTSDDHAWALVGEAPTPKRRSHRIIQPNIGGMTQINQSPEISGGVSAVLPRANVATAPPHGSVRRRSRPAQASVAVSSSLQVLHCSRDECAAQYLVAFGDGYCASVRLQAPRSAGRAPEQVQQGLGKADELYCEFCPIRRGSPPP